MLDAERFRVLLFVAAIGTVYVLAGGTRVRLALARAGRYELPHGRVYRWTRRTVLALAGIGLLCFAYVGLREFAQIVSRGRALECPDATPAPMTRPGRSSDQSSRYQTTDAA